MKENKLNRRQCANLSLHVDSLTTHKHCRILIAVKMYSGIAVLHPYYK